MKQFLAVIAILLLPAGLAFSQGGVKKKKPLPYEYGNVVIDNFSTKAGLNPVLFEHWLHRGRFTCRVCHVDIGFAMRAGESHIKSADNMKGYFCGACHNGRMAAGADGRRVFAACSTEVSKDDARRCARCHVLSDKNAPDLSARREIEFSRFTERLPRERLGNGINWEKAENAGLIKPIDFIEGVSIKRSSLGVQKDFAIGAKIDGVPQIIFSHKKHTVWNGCEVCHPEIFMGVKRGASQYSMIDLFEGKYCGVCHDKVAFPQSDCTRCHTKPV
jgi:c(7)-type cytochrome triheme protein